MAHTCMGGGDPYEVKRSEEWTEPTFGEGPMCFDCHVQVPTKWHKDLPDISDHEKRGF